MTHLTIRVAAAIAALLIFAGPLTAAPAIEVVSNGLRATGITPGADAVWFGMTIDTFNMTRRLMRHATVVRDEDRDGVVFYEMPEVSRFSLLFAADTTTGDYAVFRAEGVDHLEFNLRGKEWRAQLEHLDIAADVAEVLLIRPGEGAWAMRAMEGGGNDGDSALNGKIRLKVKDMDPIGSAAAKPNGPARRGDLLIIFDSRTFAYAVRQAQD